MSDTRCVTPVATAVVRDGGRRHQRRQGEGLGHVVYEALSFSPEMFTALVATPPERRKS